jgi:hypothetical protein
LISCCACVASMPLLEGTNTASMATMASNEDAVTSARREPDSLARTSTVGRGFVDRYRYPCAQRRHQGCKKCAYVMRMDLVFRGNGVTPPRFRRLARALAAGGIAEPRPALARPMHREGSRSQTVRRQL